MAGEALARLARSSLSDLAVGPSQASPDPVKEQVDGSIRARWNHSVPPREELPRRVI